MSKATFVGNIPASKWVNTLTIPIGYDPLTNTPIFFGQGSRLTCSFSLNYFKEIMQVDYRREAVLRMKRRNKRFICWSLQDRTIEFSFIQEFDAKNYDGSYSGLGCDSGRIVLQRATTINGGMPRYSNYW